MDIVQTSANLIHTYPNPNSTNKRPNYNDKDETHEDDRKRKRVE